MAKIKALRKAAGLTQQQLADKIRVKRTTLCMWEIRNGPPAKYLTRIADVLGCTVDDLLRDEQTA